MSCPNMKSWIRNTEYTVYVFYYVLGVSPEELDRLQSTNHRVYFSSIKTVLNVCYNFNFIKTFTTITSILTLKEGLLLKVEQT